MIVFVNDCYSLVYCELGWIFDFCIISFRYSHAQIGLEKTLDALLGAWEDLQNLSVNRSYEDARYKL